MPVVTCKRDHALKAILEILFKHKMWGREREKNRKGLRRERSTYQAEDSHQSWI